MNDRDQTWTWVAVLIVAWLLLSGGGGGTFSPSKATAAVYVYEKDAGGVPPAVGAGINKLNEVGIVATTFEEDTTDASGQVPDQYKVPLVAAREAGLPALVVMAGEKVLRVVKKPETEADMSAAVFRGPFVEAVK